CCRRMPFDPYCTQMVTSLIPPECRNLTCKKRPAASYCQPAGAESSPDCDSWGKSVPCSCTRGGAEAERILSTTGRAVDVLLWFVAAGELWYRSSVPSNTVKLPDPAG